jgi:ADP-heptose:LPS heptosyltransferase
VRGPAGVGRRSATGAAALATSDQHLAVSADLWQYAVVRRTEGAPHDGEWAHLVELVEYAFNARPESTPQLKLTAENNRHLLEKFHLKNQDFYIVHPGMAGSALNWPSEKYNELIEKLITDHIVVLTGTIGDNKYLSPIKEKWQNHPNLRNLQNKLSMQELLSLLTMSRGLVAPSTGVLHLASSLGVRAVGIYSPILAHHPKRWGPRGSGVYILPDVKCPAKTECLKERCMYYDKVKKQTCMGSITVSSVLEKLTR